MDKRFIWAFTNPMGTGGVVDVCLFLSCGGVGPSGCALN